MPNIEKTIKKKKVQSQKTSRPVPTKTSPTKSPQSTHDYYCCCAKQTKSGIPKGTKITQLTKYCKKQASALGQAQRQLRETEKKKILENWKQIGLSLGKIIAQA